MKKVAFIDTQSVGNFHEIFNLSLLYIMSQSFERVEYFASKSSIENLMSKISSNPTPENIIFKQIYVPEGSTSWQIMLRNLYGAIKTFFLIIRFRKNKIFLGSLNSFSTPYLNLVSRVLKTEINIVCHGELEYVIKKDIPLFKPLRIYKKLIFSFLQKKIHPGITLLLLGDSIRTNLVALFPQNSNRYSVMNHPYFFKKNNTKPKEKSKILNLGVVGFVSKEKGIDDFFLLAEYLREDIEKKNLKLNIIGSHNYNIADYPLVNFIANKSEKLTIDRFNNEIEKLDAVLFFYNSTMYKLTASGAIFDAINNKKKIISLDNDYFRSVLGDSNIGIVCNNIGEMKKVIEEIISGKNSFYSTDAEFEEIQSRYDYKNILLP